MITVSPFGKRTVSPEFWNLPASGRLAVIAHEAGHRYHGHIARRWFVRFGWPPHFHTQLYHSQEFEADRFAAECGYARELAAVLATQPHEATATHPATRERIARLLQSVRV